MPSDIWIKATSGSTLSTWKKATKIFIKYTTGTALSAWKTATAVWQNMGAGWTRIWPLSGIFNVNPPYITTSSTSTTHLDYGNVIRIGTTYYGKNGTWNANGWSITSYNYAWRTYSSSSLTNQGESVISSGVYSAPTSLTISSTTDATNHDRRWLSFFIEAKSSGGTAYDGTQESGNGVDGRIKIVRNAPTAISYGFNTGPYYEGSTISFSSSWNTTEAYKPDSPLTRATYSLSPGTIKWYYVSDLSNVYASGSRVEIARASGLYSWTILASDNLAGKYIVAEETTFNSGSDWDYGNNGFVNGRNQITLATTSSVLANTIPGDFNITSVTKGAPFGAYGSRTLTASWGAATNAASYKYFIEGSSDGTTWINATTNLGANTHTFANTSTTSTTLTITLDYLKYYRISIRAVSATNGTKDATNAPFQATGANPEDPKSLSVSSKTQNSISVGYTATTVAGSNTYTGVQYKVGTGSWSATTTNNPVVVSGLTANTSYTIYLRSTNEDGLTSAGSANVTDTTLQNFTQGTVSVSGTSTSTADGYVSSGATMTVSTSGWPTGTTFTYQWKRTGSGQSTVLNGGTATTQAAGTSTLGEYWWCVVSYSNTTYGASGTVATYSYTVVPAAPAYTLTGGIESFTISSVSSSQGSSYFGSYSGSSSGSVAETTIASSKTVSSIAAGTINVRLYARSIAQIGGVNTTFDSWEYTDKSATVTAQPNYQLAGNKRRVTLPSAFINGQLIWISTNGYINWNTNAYPASIPTALSYPTTGVTLSPLFKDLVQTALYTYANSTSYTIRYQGYQYGDSTKTVDFQVIFYFSQSYADVYFVTNNLSSDADTRAVQAGSTVNLYWSGSTSSTAQTLLATTGMTAQTTNNNVDDAITALYAQYVAPPFFPPHFPPFFPPFFPPHFPPFFPPYFPPFFPPFFPPYFPPFFPPYFPTTKAPNAPTGLSTPSSGTSPNLVFNSSSWTAPTTDASHDAATYYQVYFEASNGSTGGTTGWVAANNTFSYNYYPGSPPTTATNANTAASAVSVYATSVSSGKITSGTTYTWVRMWVRAANAGGYSAWVSQTG